MWIIDLYIRPLSLQLSEYTFRIRLRFEALIPMTTRNEKKTQQIFEKMKKPPFFEWFSEKLLYVKSSRTKRKSFKIVKLRSERETELNSTLVVFPIDLTLDNFNNISFRYDCYAGCWKWWSETLFLIVLLACLAQILKNIEPKLIVILMMILHFAHSVFHSSK